MNLFKFWWTGDSRDFGRSGDFGESGDSGESDKLSS